MLPDFLKPLLWSYDISKLDLERSKKTVIVNVLNYGNLTHWRWLKATYGKEAVRRLLITIPATELRPRARRLAALLFSVDESQFRHAPRGAR